MRCSKLVGCHHTDCKMSKLIVNTHAGNDSDGKLWGIEGVNILFILAGLLLSVGLSLLLFRGQTHPPAFSFGVGSLYPQHGYENQLMPLHRSELRRTD